MIDSRSEPRRPGLWALPAAVFLFFIFNVRRYAGFLIDDAYISLRYSRNWLEGQGLVFNPGEVVEGYTNFLWTVLGAFGLALGFDGMVWWKGLSVLAAGILLWRLAILCRDCVGRDILRTGTGVIDGVIGVPWILLLGLEAFGYWLTTGMETMLYACLFVSALGLALRESIERRRLGSVLVFVALALTRPEGVMVFALVHAVVWWTQERRLADLRRHVEDGVIFGLLYGVYFAWRFSYYGRPFPNTYYAKITGGSEQWINGLINLKQYTLSQPVFAAAWLISAALFLGRESRRRFRRLMVPWAVGVAYIAYVVSVGGDFMPFFRFFLPVIPLAAVLVAACLLAWVRRPAARVAWVALLCLVQMVSGAFDEQSYRAFVAHRTTVVGQDVGRFFAHSLEPGQWMGVNTVGSLPYESRLPTIDGLGLTDAAIAEHPIYVVSRLWAGHRRGWGEYMRRRKPEAVVWYNSAGLRQPHYLGDRQLANDPYFRFFYQLQAQSLPARHEDRVLERFLGTPFGEPAADHPRLRAPELGLSFEVRPGFVPVTVAHDAPIELIYFRLRSDAEVFWPWIEEAGGKTDRRSVSRFLDRVSSHWSRHPRPAVDPRLRAQVESLCESARQAHGRGSVAEAKALLSRASALNGQAQSPRVPQYVANIAALEKDLFLAVQAQREALRLDPGNALYRRNLESLLNIDYDTFTATEKAPGANSP